MAALTLMGKLKEGLVDREELVNWCLARQISGFQGRPNKKEDTCYCFWIGGALQVWLAYMFEFKLFVMMRLTSTVNFK